MTLEDFKDRYVNKSDVAIFTNPSYDDCLIGITIDDRAVYSMEKMVLWLMKTTSYTFQEAVDFVFYDSANVCQKQIHSPIIIDDLTF